MISRNRRYGQRNRLQYNVRHVLFTGNDIINCKYPLLTILFIVSVLLYIVSQSRPNDECGGRNLLQELCNQYYRKEISGDICFSLCEEKVHDLSNCIDDGQYIKTFLINKELVVKVPVSILKPENNLILSEGLTADDFTTIASKYLQAQLGHSSFDDLIRKFLKIADFNQNQELSLGEVQSIWRLMNIQEFLFLTIFNKQIAIPKINGTCGSLYRYNYKRKHILYKDDKSGFLTPIFKNSYRWSFPGLHKRIKIAVGLLELVLDLSEAEGIPFYLCNLSPSILGYTSKYELILDNLKDLKTTAILKNDLVNVTCTSDKDCEYSHQCQSVCDVATGHCTGEVMNSQIFYVCDILKEYLLLGSTGHFHYDLKHFLSKCSNIIIRKEQYSLYVHELKDFLWDIIKNED